MKKILCVLLALCLMLSLCACGKKNKGEADTETLYQLMEPSTGDTVATIETNLGDIKIVLFPKYAPKACENFVGLAEAGYYDGCTVHKIIADFCIQTGDPTGTGSGGESIWTGGFENEYSNELHHYVGAVGMANDGGTNGSQFYIVTGAEVPENVLSQLIEGDYPADVVEAYKTLGGQPKLDYRYTVFAQVYEGMDIVEKIGGKPADELMRPEKDIKVKSVRVEVIGAEE